MWEQSPLGAVRRSATGVEPSLIIPVERHLCPGYGFEGEANGLAGSVRLTAAGQKAPSPPEFRQRRLPMQHLLLPESAEG